MMEPSCGSVQANARKAPWYLEETRVSSNGQSISAKKRREKAKTAGNVLTAVVPQFFTLVCGEHNPRKVL